MKVQYYIKSQLDESSEVDENLVVDVSSVKLVGESSVIVENTGLKLEELEEKAVVYQSVFSRETQLGKVQMKCPTYGLCFIHWATTRMRYKHGLKTNHRFGIQLTTYMIWKETILPDQISAGQLSLPSWNRVNTFSRRYFFFNTCKAEFNGIIPLL